MTENTSTENTPTENALIETRKPRLTVELPNFAHDELNCSCGCGKQLHEMAAICLQALIFRLRRIRSAPVRIVVHCGARCEPNQRRVYTEEVPVSQRIGPDDPTPTSYHMGMDRKDHGPDDPGAACDCHLQEQIRGEWRTIPHVIVGKEAKLSGLFGGIGTYPWGVHLDPRPGLTMWG